MTRCQPILYNTKQRKSENTSSNLWAETRMFTFSTLTVTLKSQIYYKPGETNKKDTSRKGRGQIFPIYRCYKPTLKTLHLRLHQKTLRFYNYIS